VRKMDALCDLLFELSNDDRLQILYEIKKNPIKLSHISKKLNFTTQATARNIYRLAEFGIIRKKENSDYILTPFGTTSLALLDSYHFITENKGYLLSHWTKNSPLNLYHV